MIRSLFLILVLLPGVATATESHDPSAAAMTEGEVVAALRALADSLARADAFSGAVLLARGDRVLLREAWGLASRADRTPNRPDTRFNLGSINKKFTQVAIHQLAAAGKLRLDDTIDRWLSDYPQEQARKITIRHLLEHQGGTGDIFNQLYQAAARSRIRTIADWYALIRNQPLAFEPGARTEYSNAGYVLLGAIVEKASGQDYYEYIREHVYRPAGMTASDHDARDEKTPNRAIGYTRLVDGAPAGDLRDASAERPGRGSSAGGGYSTVDDLFRFAQAMRAGRLGMASRAEGIAGGSPGCNAVLEMMDDYTLIVLANLDPPAASRLAAEARGWMPRADIASGGELRMIPSHAHTPGSRPGQPATPGRRAIRRGGADDPDRKPRRTAIPAAGVAVPMLASGHLPAVDIMVNGQGPFRFVIDTGAAGSARLDSALAARLGLRRVGEVLGGDPSGLNSRRMALVAVDSIEIGGARFVGLTAAVRDLGERAIGEPVDGILGLGVFAEGLVTLDYPQKRIRITAGELPPADGAGVLDYRDGRGVPQVTLRVAGHEVEADVDAGAPGGFTLPEAMAAKLPLVSPPRVVGRARTMSNTFEIKAAELRGEVTLGRFTYASPTLEFQPLFPSANVGAKVLRDFSVSFDQKNRRMRLAKPA